MVEDALPASLGELDVGEALVVGLGEMLGRPRDDLIKRSSSDIS